MWSLVVTVPIRTLFAHKGPVDRQYQAQILHCGKQAKRLLEVPAAGKALDRLVLEPMSGRNPTFSEEPKGATPSTGSTPTHCL